MAKRFIASCLGNCWNEIGARSEEGVWATPWTATDASSAATSMIPRGGDPGSGIFPGVSFEDLSDDRVCPECGVDKDQFERVEE